MAAMNVTIRTDLKKNVSDILGVNVSKMLLGRIHALLDEEQGDPASLRKTCLKIEQMVSLFHGPDKGKMLAQRFKETLSRF